MRTKMNNSKPDTELVVSRLRRDLRNRLSHLAGKRGATIASLNNEAVTRFLNSEEFTFVDLMEKICRIPSLRIHEKLIEKELKGCPSNVCKEIFGVIRDSNPFLLQEKLEDVPKKVAELSKKQLSGLFLHISKDKVNVNELNNIINEIKDSLKKQKIKIGAIATERPEDDSTIIFGSYKKEDENDDK